MNATVRIAMIISFAIVFLGGIALAIKNTVADENNVSVCYVKGQEKDNWFFEKWGFQKHDDGWAGVFWGHCDLKEVMRILTPQFKVKAEERDGGVITISAILLAFGLLLFPFMRRRYA